LKKLVKQKTESSNIPSTEIVPEGQMTELEMLKGFKNMVAERYCYVLAKKAQSSDLNEKTEKERKASATAGKTVSKALETFLEDSTDVNRDAYKAAIKDLGKARKELSTARTATGLPDKIKELSSGIAYMDKIAIPDSLKELGTPIAPRFTLSEYVKSSVDAMKKKKD
jgi:hypothetical protein